MLSFERTKELLNDLDLTDKEIEEARVLSSVVAGIAFDAWMDEVKKKELKHGDTV